MSSFTELSSSSAEKETI